ncbi:MAG: hypothetical protein Kow00109_18930 [Acidobacteriota bacterium]
MELHYTPVHGSWLNMAEIELSALQGQCLNRRIADAKSLASQIAAWQRSRNGRATKIQWHFTTEDARRRLRRLYPTL